MPDPDATDGAPSTGPDPEGYGEAMSELERILAEIEDDAVDVDVLATRVARAAHLVRWCRGRLDGARVDVEAIVADLEARAEPSSPPEG